MLIRLSPSFKEMAEICSKVISDSFLQNARYDELMSSIKENVKSLSLSMSSVLNATYNLNNESSENIEIEFTDRQLINIEKFEVNINNYCDKSKSNKFTKFFTKESIIALIGVLISLLGYIQQILPNKEQQKQTKLMQEEVEEFKEISANTEEIIELLRENLERSTLDEANHLE